MVKSLFLHCSVPLVFVLFSVTGVLASPKDAGLHWRQWAGPNSNFKVDSPPLLSEWPEDGPKQLWSVELGDGYSAIAYDDGHLYTLFREGDDEVVVCLTSDSGKEIWRQQYKAPLHEKMYKNFGVGPRAMPVIHGDYVYSSGIAGKFLCLDKKSGKIAWSKELVDDIGGSVTTFGYSTPPLVYNDQLIVMPGGKGHAIMALHPETGKVLWQAQDFVAGYAAPMVINVQGEDQLVVFMAKEIAGLNPNDGTLKWSFPTENQWGTNCTTPIYWDNKLFVTTEEVGSRVLALDRAKSKTTVKEVWFKRKPQIVFCNAVNIDNFVVGAFGVKPAPFSALDLTTGEYLWRDRKFNKATSILADGKLIVLDEDGKLAIGTATRDDFTVHSQFQLFENRSWSVPTLIGSKLYVRNVKKMVALELGGDQG